MLLTVIRRTVLSLALTLPAPLSAQVHCDVLRTATGAYAGRCTMNSQAVLMLVLRSPESGTTGRWHGTEARILGTAGDNTKDVIDWQDRAILNDPPQRNAMR